MAESLDWDADNGQQSISHTVWIYLGLEKPYLSITACPSGESTKLTKAFARSGLLLALSAAIGYVAMVFRASGIAMVPTLSLASPLMSVT